MNRIGHVSQRSFDVIIVGARAAGSPLALRLSKNGMRVLLIDRATFPSDTLSTHVLFPNVLAELQELGVVDALASKHEIPLLDYRMIVLEEEITGRFTPVGGFDRLACISRFALDAAMLESALQAGAKALLGVRVKALLGDGTDVSPVRGVVTEDGREFHADLVIGADGRSSTVAKLLGVQNTQSMWGEMSWIFTYWRGLPDIDALLVEVDTRRFVQWAPCEDGRHLVVLGARDEELFGPGIDRERLYPELLKSFWEKHGVDAATATYEPRLRGATQPLLVGHYRQPYGPGWVLVGDAVNFKHPGTGQGIGDAIDHGRVVADLVGSGVGLEPFAEFLSQSQAHYKLSFQFAKWPSEFSRGIFQGMARDRDAAQNLRDCLAKQFPADDVLTREKVSRWLAASAGS